MNEAVREMTFEEEFEILQREKERVFASEKEGYEPPLANCVLRRALRCIRKLQEQQPKTDWIPCEERLPELDAGTEYFKQSKHVLTAIEWWDGEITEEVGWYNESGVWNHDSKNSKVIAWQPFQAYKKEGAEQ